MRTVYLNATFESWRDQARLMLAEGAHPTELLWADDREQASLFSEATPQTPAKKPLTVSKAFLDFARSAAAHHDPRRWALLYQILWRLTLGKEKHLLSIATDPDIRIAGNWVKAVSREIHKMHAFVRFRLVQTHPVSGREQFVAWFEPEFRIVQLASPFFIKRFTNFDWSILTPHECAHWDGHRLSFTEGVTQDCAPSEEALDELWLTYYQNIFNPARLKTKAMQSEMPKKYWKNLPEASLIQSLISGSQKQVQSMYDTKARPVKPRPKNAYLEQLHQSNVAPTENPEE